MCEVMQEHFLPRTIVLSISAIRSRTIRWFAMTWRCSDVAKRKIKVHSFTQQTLFSGSNEADFGYVADLHGRYSQLAQAIWLQNFQLGDRKVHDCILPSLA